MVKPFKFKEFTVQQDTTAMKVGTDAVLLGAWVSIKDRYSSVLDVGSGTGVIALMLAQRSCAETIDAIEIDENAYEQTVENFEQSDWGDRLFCYHTSFQEFATEMAAEEEEYDLIVSNPPFYTDDFQSENDARNKARFTSSLSFEELHNGVAKLLSKNGCFAVIIPFKEEERFIRLAEKEKLYPMRMCRVRGNPAAEIKRSLLAFSFAKKEIKNEELIIETARHQYTKEYIELTKNFYLKM